MGINLDTMCLIKCAKCGKPLIEKWLTINWELSNGKGKKCKEICYDCYQDFKEWFYNIPKENKESVVEVFYIK